MAWWARRAPPAAIGASCRAGVWALPGALPASGRANGFSARELQKYGLNDAENALLHREGRIVPPFVHYFIRLATTSGTRLASSARLWPWEREKPAVLWMERARRPRNTAAEPPSKEVYSRSSGHLPSVEANRRRLPPRPRLDRLAAST